MSIALQILLNDSEIDGKKTVYLSNRDIRCEYVPRQKVSTFSSNEVAIYLLVGVDEEKGEMIYVGETEGASTRLLDHHKKKIFWDYAFFFVSNTGHLNKADVKFLESKIYHMIKEAGRYYLENTTVPKESHVHTIRKTELMDILKTIEFILGGAFNLFPFKKVDIETDVANTQSQIDQLKQQLDSLEIFYMKQKQADARGYLIGEGKKFVILKGSKTAPIEKMANSFKNLSAVTYLENLQKQGVIEEVNGYYQFKENHIFNSPSAASCIIYLASTNGWQEWKNEAGESLEKLRN